MSDLDRRRFLKATSAITLASFAGCAGGGDGDDGDGGDGEDGGGGGSTETETEAPMTGEQGPVELNGFKVPGENVVPKSELSSEREIPTLDLITNPPKASPNDHQFGKAFAKAASELGIDMQVKIMPWSSQADKVWDTSDWDLTQWQMVGRPSRLDPDEFLVQMFHSGYQNGYNYYYWEDDEYDEVVMAQREERDQDKRQELVYQAQEIIHDRGPSTFTMYPQVVRAWNKEKWEGVVVLSGMGARNMLTFSNLKPKTDDTEVVMSYPSKLQNINPFNQSGEVDMVQHRMLWDRLVWPNKNALPEPRLAKELNWKDDTTLEVPIKENGQFHNGNDLLAEDVKFSFDVHRNYSTYFSAPLKPVESIEVTDDYRVEFSLKSHFAPFALAGLGRIAIVSKQHWTDIIENKMDVENPMLHQEDAPLGSGPLQFDKWEKGNEVRLAKFEDHWDPVAYDGLTTRIIPSVQTILTQLENGTVDITGGYSGDKSVLQEKVNQNDHLEMAATTTVGFKQVSYNNDRPPMQIDAFRQAMQHRYDSELVVNQIYDGWGEHDGHVPTSTALEKWHNPNLEPYEFSLQAAANKLVEAGFVWDEDSKRLHMPADRTELKPEEIGESKPENE
ncbi:MAG: ABC transporter substrate-binding protein [Halobacteriales archaeon]